MTDAPSPELLAALQNQIRSTEMLLRRHGYSEQDVLDCTSQARAAIEANIRPFALALRVVAEQAHDHGLWFVAETITEDTLQRALRRLHSAVESAIIPTPEPRHDAKGGER